MKRVLTFTTAEVKPLVDQALAATEHRPSYTQQGIAPADIPAALWLVKDQGVYLMSNGALSKDSEGFVVRAATAYAAECNPTTLEFEEWYGNARAIMGGDDSVESLPLEWFDGVLKRNKPTFRLYITDDAIELR